MRQKTGKYLTREDLQVIDEVLSHYFTAEIDEVPRKHQEGFTRWMEGIRSKIRNEMQTMDESLIYSTHLWTN